jgi:muconolactone delta-isomerase
MLNLVDRDPWRLGGATRAWRGKADDVEYLVTMTTHVPDGVSEAEVDEVRGREAAHSRELAAGGQLLRLWRPPLQPGQWRTLGLFTADDEDRLERVLAAMPLRIWRTDQVAALVPHSNDPPSPGPARAGATEFFTWFTFGIADGVDPAEVDRARTAEAGRTRELAAQGHLRRIWTVPEQGRALGLWQAQEIEELRPILDGLPLAPWLDVEIVPLSVHPSDPGHSPDTV